MTPSAITDKPNAVEGTCDRPAPTYNPYSPTHGLLSLGWMVNVVSLAGQKNGSLLFHNGAHSKLGMTSCCMNVWRKTMIGANSYRKETHEGICQHTPSITRRTMLTKPVVTVTSQARAFLAISWRLWQHVGNTQTRANTHIVTAT